MIGVTLLVIGILVVFIWVTIEFKRMKHKVFAIFLIALILFAYVTGMMVLRGEDVNLKTVPGIIQASKLYFSWLGSAFGNVQAITTNAIRMDWSGNETG